MVLGRLPVPGRPSGLNNGGARAYCAYGGCGWGFFGPVCHFSSFSKSRRRPDLD